MPALTMLRLLASLAVLPWHVPAPWVPAGAASNSPTRITVLRLRPSGGYDMSAGSLPTSDKDSLQAARNMALVVTAQVGTPAQTLKCLLDTSIAETWIPSKKCASCVTNPGEAAHFFDVASSTSLKLRGATSAYGGTLQSLKLVYGDGSVSGYVASDTVAVGNVQVPSQTILVAEDGDEASRATLGWDGVLGIGDRGLGESRAGTPFMKQPGVGVFSLVLRPDGTAGSFSIGEPSAALVDTSSITWARNLAPGGVWTLKAQLTLTGAASAPPASPSRAIVEAGTSYVLLPSDVYSSFMRALLPGAYDVFCAEDRYAGGGAVVCDCQARDLIGSSMTLVVEVTGEDGVAHKLPLTMEDLFEEVESASQGAVCLPQIQRLPWSSDHKKTFGVLGPPYSEVPASGAAGSPAWPGVFPLGPQIGSVPMMPGPQIIPPMPAPDTPSEQAMEELGRDMANKSVLSRNPGEIVSDMVNAGMMESPSSDSVFREIVYETLRDGTECETVVTQAVNGTVIGKTTTATSPTGEALASPEFVCARTHADGVQSRRRLLELQGAPSTSATETPEATAWVIGGLFLRRYAVLFDARGERLGITTPATGASAFEAVPVTPVTDAAYTAAGSGQTGSVTDGATDESGSESQYASNEEETHSLALALFKAVFYLTLACMVLLAVPFAIRRLRSLRLFEVQRGEEDATRLTSDAQEQGSYPSSHRGAE